MDARASRLPRGLLVAALVYLALRAALLAGRFDEVSNPDYELTMVGNLAHAVHVGHRALPLSGYFDNCGGHLTSGLLATPLYALFGDRYLVLKLVPLLHGLVALVLAWAIVAPRAGRAAATLTCAALALGPPLLARLSVMALGNHFESLVPTFATYLAWLRWRERGERRDALLFGVAAGLSVFLYLGSPLWLALLALAHLRARGLRASLRDGLDALPGLALGLAPLAWIALATGGRLLGFLDHNLGAEALPTAAVAAARAWELATRVLPTAGLYPDLGPLPGRLAEGSWLAACALAWAVLARASLRRDAPALPLVLYPAGLVAVLAVSRFDIEPLTAVEHAATRRYLAPWLGLCALSLGLAHGELARAGRARLAAGLAGLVLATAPFALALALPADRRGPSGWELRGWSGTTLSRLLLRDAAGEPVDGRPTWDLAGVVERVDALPEAEREEVAFGLGFALGLPAPRDPFGATAPLVAALPAELVEPAHEGVGAFLREAHRYGVLAPEDVRRVLAAAAERDPAAASAAARGLSREYFAPVGPRGPPAVEQARALAGHVPVALRAAFAEGLARAEGQE